MLVKKNKYPVVHFPTNANLKQVIAERLHHFSQCIQPKKQLFVMHSLAGLERYEIHILMIP